LSADEDLPGSTVGISAGLFDALGIRLVAGRTFTGAETSDPTARVTVINQRLAARLWPNQSALDRRVGLGGSNGVVWLRVVGVAPDVHYEELGEETDSSRMNLYVPYAFSGARTMAFVINTEGAPVTLVQPVRDVLQQLHAGLPLYELMPMTERRRFTTWEERFFGQMMGAFALVALLLACLGVYALLSYAARRRTQEIGVRLALGARPNDVVWLFVRQGSAVGLGGLAIGLLLAVVVSRGLRGLLWGVEAFDLPLFGGIGAALLGVVLFASYWPARRASRVDPIAALRAE
jgi:hypothetical protein